MPCSKRGTLLLLMTLAAVAVLSAGQAPPVVAAPEPQVPKLLDAKFERKLAVEGPLRLDVSTLMGNIVVRTGEANEVRVVGTVHIPRGVLLSGLSTASLRALLEEPPIEQKGRRIRVGRLKDHDLRTRLAISYEIFVPAETELRATTGMGDHVIEGLRRKVQASAGTGNLLVSDVAAEVRLATGLGDVDVRDIRGPVRASSRGGHIRAAGAPDANWRIGTDIGDVSVRLPAGARFELHARSSVGGIRVDHPVVLAGPASAGEMHGKVRGGGPKLELETRLGSIRIE
jgi:hypothetical protein